MTGDRIFIIFLGIIVTGSGFLFFNNTIRTLKTTPVKSSIGILLSLALIFVGILLLVKPGVLFSLFH